MTCKIIWKFKAFEHSVRFYASYVQKSKATETFETTTSDILKHLISNASGQIMRVAKASKS